MKAPVRGLGSDFGCSWRPSWGHVDNLGGYLGGLKAPVGSRRRFWVLSETILGPCWRSWGLSWNFEGPSWYLGGDFGCSWRPSWSHVGDLGGYLGHLRAYVGRSWLGKPTKWTSYRYLRGFSEKVLWRCWQMLASAGKCWEVRRNGASLCDFVRSLQISSLRFSTPCSPFGGGGLRRFAHTAGLGIMEQRGN